MNFRLHPVGTTGEVYRCAAIAALIWHEWYVPIIGEAQVAYMLDTLQSEAAIAAQIENGFDYYLLYHDRVSVGYLATHAEDEALMISKLYVVHSARGLGAGRFMIDACIASAKALELSRLELTVNRHNPSLSFYARLGFENAGTRVAQIGGGFVMDDYVMRLEL